MRGAYGSMEYSCPNTLVGSIKLQVSFAKEPYKRDNILRKYGIQLPYGSMEYSCPNTFFLYILFFLFLSLWISVRRGCHQIHVLWNELTTTTITTPEYRKQPFGWI